MDPTTTQTAEKAWEWWEHWVAWASFGASIAAIATGLVAVWAYSAYVLTKCDRRKKLEAYLKDRRSDGDGTYRQSVIHLMAYLRMTESQVYEAAFDSKHVIPSPGQDNLGIANRVFFEYTTGDETADFEASRGNTKVRPR